ncbi:glycosyltransferase family 4 protein [Mycolicibacterium rufum]
MASRRQASSKPPTRALWVSSSLSTYGGIATFVNNMRETALWQEWDVHHVATHCDGSKLRRVGIFARGLILFSFQMTFNRPQIVHLHTSERGSFVRKGFLVWLSSLYGVPTILHMHGGEFHEYFRGARPSVQRLISTTLVRADVIVALGETWASRVREVAPGARVEIVPNAIKRHDQVMLRPHNTIQFTFLGELCDRKGIGNLIKAWAQLIKASDGPTAVLSVAGWGEIEKARTQINTLAVADSVRLCGWLSKSQVSDLLDRTCVLVLPSINEGQPMAILEAMSRGICVVSTTAGGIPEMIGDGEGVLVQPGNVRELTEALKSVLRDAEYREALGINGRRRALQDFDVEVISRKFDTMYRSLLRPNSDNGRKCGTSITCSRGEMTNADAASNVEDD